MSFWGACAGFFAGEPAPTTTESGLRRRSGFTREEARTGTKMSLPGDNPVVLRDIRHDPAG
ncbi:hypothetical protein METHP14_230031 [Pseudomonas sp. P14-2025]